MNLAFSNSLPEERVVFSIVQAVQGDHTAIVHDLFEEYLKWACAALYREYDITFDAEAMLEHDMADIGIFLPPAGHLLLAYDDVEVAGCACTRTIGPQTAELKRMYVRPAYRRKGAGRALVEATINKVRAAGYSALRLDSARFMTDAHALYRSAGFREIPPYPQSEIPEEFRVHWVFMERPLAVGPA
jgi:GNAT superfamily N-acetyltransferase